MIGILGAGSLGRLWGAMLPNGCVAFVARPGETTDSSVDYRFRPFEGPESSIQIPFLRTGDTPDLMLVTTKAGDTLSAVAGVIEARRAGGVEREGVSTEASAGEGLKSGLG